jgi:hypothetical protein
MALAVHTQLRTLTVKLCSTTHQCRIGGPIRPATQAPRLGPTFHL